MRSTIQTETVLPMLSGELAIPPPPPLPSPHVSFLSIKYLIAVYNHFLFEQEGFIRFEIQRPNPCRQIISGVDVTLCGCADSSADCVP